MLVARLKVCNKNNRERLHFRFCAAHHETTHATSFMQVFMQVCAMQESLCRASYLFVYYVLCAVVVRGGSGAFKQLRRPLQET